MVVAVGAVGKFKKSRAKNPGRLLLRANYRPALPVPRAAAAAVAAVSSPPLPIHLREALLGLWRGERICIGSTRFSQEKQRERERERERNKSKKGLNRPTDRARKDNPLHECSFFFFFRFFRVIFHFTSFALLQLPPSFFSISLLAHAIWHSLYLPPTHMYFF